MLVKDFMTTGVFSCYETQELADAAKLLVDKRISCVPILNSDELLVGIITESDFFGKTVDIPHALASVRQIFNEKFYYRSFENIYEKLKNTKIKEVMTRNPRTVPPNVSLDSVARYMVSKNIRRIPVVEEGKVVGIITRKNIVKGFTNL